MADVRMYAGDTWRRTWKLKQADGAPVDLTGATARLHLRDSAGTLVVEASTGLDGRIVITGAIGQIAMTVSASVTAGIAVGRYRWALELTELGGIVTTLESGTMVILEDITYG
jgi:hypothetical protein